MIMCLHVGLCFLIHVFSTIRVDRIAAFNILGILSGGVVVKYLLIYFIGAW